MNPLYPFNALETVKTFHPLPQSCTNEDDVAYIKSQFNIKKVKRMAEAAYRFATSNRADGPLNIRLERGVVIIPTNEGNNLFVSIKEKLASKGAEGWKIKKIAMIKVDSNGRVVRSKGGVQWAVKISQPFNKNSNKDKAITRRLSTMQKFDGSPYFPTTYGYVYREGKRGRKISLFQELAIMDLVDYNNKCTGIHTFSTLDKLAFCKAALGAIRTFEDARMIHRDLKFDNILIFKNDGPNEKQKFTFKVTDFGLACRTDDNKASKTLCGSVAYLPPEYISHLGTEATDALYKDTSGDLWALGIMLYYISNAKMHPIQTALSGLEADKPTQQFWSHQTFYSCISASNNAYASLPPPPDKIESLADLAQAILQPVTKRIRLADAQAACDTLFNNQVKANVN